MERNTAFGLIAILGVAFLLLWLAVILLARQCEIPSREYLARLAAGLPQTRPLVPSWKRCAVVIGRIWAVLLGIAGAILLIAAVAKTVTASYSQTADAALDGLGSFIAGIAILHGVVFMWRALDAWLEASAPSDDRGI